MAAIARGGVASLLGSGVSALSQLAVVLVVTRLFSAADVGALFAATAMFFMASAVVQLGTDQGLVRFVAASRARGDGDQLRPILRIGLLPVAGTATVAAAALYALSGPIAGLLGPDAERTAAQMLQVLAVALPFAALHEAFLAASRGLGSLRSTVLVERIVRPVLQPMAIVAVAAAGLGVDALAPAWAAPYLVAVVASGLAMRRTLRRVEAASRSAPATAGGTAAATPGGTTAATPGGTTAATAGDSAPAAAGGTAASQAVRAPTADTTPGASLRREFWSFTSGRAVSRILQVALQRVDVILVAALVDAGAAAVYTAATRYIAVGMLANQAIQQVIQPRLAAMHARGELGLAGVVLRRTTVWLVALVWPGYLTLAVLAPALMSVFGPGYAAGAPSLVVLALAMLVASAAGPLDVALLMAGRSGVSLLNMTVALAIDVVACLLLLPHLGVTGAAVAWALAIVVRNGLAAEQSRRLLGLNATSRQLLETALLATVCCAVVPVPLALAGAPVPTTVAASAVGLLVYLAVLHRRRDHLGLHARSLAVPSAVGRAGALT